MPRGQPKNGKKSKSPWRKWNPVAFKGRPKDITDYIDTRFSTKKRGIDVELYY